MSIEERSYKLPEPAMRFQDQFNEFHDSGYASFLNNIVNQPWPQPTIKISVTNRCNLACDYCYDADRRPPLQRTTDMDPGFIGEIFKRFPDPSYVFVLGGEPFLNPEAVTEILERCPSRVTISTNGQIYNEGVKGVLDTINQRSEFDRRTLLQISCEEGGGTKARGTKNAAAILTKLSAYCESQIKVKYTMTQADIPEIEKIAAWYWQRKLPLQFDYADGGFGSGVDLNLSADKCSQVFEFTYETLATAFAEWIQSEDNDWPLQRLKIFLNPILPRTISHLFSLAPVFSACGVLGNSIYIGPGGELHPCHRWRQYDYGNWYDGNEHLEKDVSNFHREVGQVVHEKCATCQWRGTCGGVCPAVMYAYGENALLGRCKFRGAQMDAVLAYLTDEKIMSHNMFQPFVGYMLEN